MWIPFSTWADDPPSVVALEILFAAFSVEMLLEERSENQHPGIIMLTYVVCRVRLAVKPTKAGARFVRSTMFSDISHGGNDRPKTVIIMTLNIYGRSENKNKQMQHMSYLVVKHVHHGVCLPSAQLESTV